MVIGFLLFSIGGVVLLMISKLDYHIFTEPFSVFIGISRGDSSISLWPLLGGLLLLAFGISMLMVYLFLEKKLDWPPIIAILLFAGGTLGLLGLSVITLLIFAGMIIGLIAASWKVTVAEHTYIKVKPYVISTHSLTTGLRIFNIAAAIALFLFSLNNPLLAEKELDSLFQSSIGISVEDISSMNEAMLEHQKEATHHMIDMVGTSLILSLAQNSDLSGPEQINCLFAINSSLEELTNQAKEAADDEIMRGGLSANQGQINTALRIIDYFRKAFPYITAITTLMLLEFVSIFLRDLIGIFAYLIWNVMK